jgi:hypothetical protein
MRGSLPAAYRRAPAPGSGLRGESAHWRNSRMVSTNISWAAMHVRDPTLTVPQNSGKVAGSVGFRGAEPGRDACPVVCALLSTCWTLGYGASWSRGPPEGPKDCHQDARLRPSRSLAEVALALIFSDSPCRHAFLRARVPFFC